MFKTFAIAATAIALTATTAAANGSFGILDAIDEDAHTYEVNLARTSNGGVLQIETLAGYVLGVSPLQAGANDDVRVSLDGSVAANSQLVAKIIEGGDVTGTGTIWVR